MCIHTHWHTHMHTHTQKHMCTHTHTHTCARTPLYLLDAEARKEVVGRGLWNDQGSHWRAVSQHSTLTSLTDKSTWMTVTAVIYIVKPLISDLGQSVKRCSDGTAKTCCQWLLVKEGRPFVEFMCPVFTCMPHGVTLGDSSLLLCPLSVERCQLPLLIWKYACHVCDCAWENLV